MLREIETTPPTLAPETNYGLRLESFFEENKRALLSAIELLLNREKMNTAGPAVVGSAIQTIADYHIFFLTPQSQKILTQIKVNLAPRNHEHGYLGRSLGPAYDTLGIPALPSLPREEITQRLRTALSYRV